MPTAGEVPAFLIASDKLPGRTDTPAVPWRIALNKTGKVYIQNVKARHSARRMQREGLQGCSGSRVPECEDGGRGLQQ